MVDNSAEDDLAIRQAVRVFVRRAVKMPQLTYLSALVSFSEVTCDLEETAQFLCTATPHERFEDRRISGTPGRRCTVAQELYDQHVSAH